MSTNTSIPYESTLYESSTDDDVYFQSVGFFFMLNFLYFIGLASVHLVHWTINLVLEYKKTRSCGAKERAEGASGYLLLFVGACFPMIVGIWITIDIPDWCYLDFGPSECCTYWIVIAWIGTLIGLLDVLAFAYVHYSLGISWSGTVVVKQEHKLVTSGPYRLARHPMYSVVLLVPIVTLMQTSCWLYALSWAICIAIPVSRCRKEERLMQAEFGDEYRDYMDKVGPFCPINIPGWGNKLSDTPYDFTALGTDDEWSTN